MDGSSHDFERWRTRGDADALARVFDAQAPGLLRFAVHLVGDANAAEDLVQETFLAALRSAGGYDAARPIDRWLAGILVHRAQELRREARRSPSREVPETWDLDTPFESASRREISAELARAVDALEEPYRAAMLMNLHGLEPAVIAHVLGRSPGAVRVQLHRAREMLRKALPVGMAGALVLLGESARGLRSVRDQVLEHAARLAPAAGIGGGLLGGVLVMKKLAVAVAILLAGLAVFFAVARDGEARPDVPTPAPREVALVAPPAPVLATDVAPAAVADAPRSAVAEAPMPHRFTGRVLAAPDDRPVAGATVELFASVLRTRADFERRWSSRSQAMHDGWINPPWVPYEADQPTLLQLADLEPRRDYARPEPGAVPLARATTDAEGRFAFPSPTDEGVLVVRAEGFGERRYPWTQRAEATDAGRDVYVSRVGSLSAQLIDEAGVPFEERVALTLRGAIRFVLGGPDAHRDETHFDVWDVETDEKGRFNLDVGAQAVFVTSRDPSLGVRMVGWVKPGGGCASRPWLTPGGELSNVVVVRPTCVLAVSDARTGASIERFHLESKFGPNLRRGTAGWDGWFSREGGLFCLTPEMDHIADIAAREAQDGAWSGRVWAPGYAPVDVTVDSAWKAQRVEVKLEPGAIATLSGRVTRGGAPAAAVPITFHGGIGARWEPAKDEPGSRWAPFAGTRTDGDGRFSVEVYPGRQLTTIGTGEERVTLVLEAPDAGVGVDLSQRASLRVRVAVADGASAAGRPVVVIRPDGGRIEGETDARGEYLVASTCTGVHKVGARVQDKLTGNREMDVEREVDLPAGTETTVELMLAEDAPRHGRLALVGATDPSRWKVQTRGWSNTRVAIGVDGRIPIDLRTSDSFVFFGPDGFELIVQVPKDAADGHVFTVDVVGRGYEGVLTSIVDGKPLARVQMLAYRRDGQGGGMHAATTDAQGRFRLVGLEDASYRIGFDGDSGPTAVLEYCAVFPDENPADPPRKLDLALPTRRGASFAGVETIQLVGRLRWTDQVVEGVQAQLAARVALPGAQMWATQMIYLPADGAYDVTLPRGDEYTAWFWKPATGAKGSVKWTGSGAAVETHDVELP